MYRMNLGVYWKDSPECWKKFTSSLQSNSSDEHNRKFTKGLAEFGATYFHITDTNNGSSCLEFEDAESATLFALRWS